MPRKNPFLERVESKAKGHAGRLAERKTSARLGGRLTPGSGAKDGHKGDYKLPGLLVENKSTVNESLSLKLEWLKKISKEAMPKDLVPALSIQFTDDTGKPQPSGSWVMVPEWAFDQMKEALGGAA